MTDRQSAHVTDEQLAAFATGKASEDEITAIGVHLDSCPPCQVRLRQRPPDRLTQSLQQSRSLEEQLSSFREREEQRIIGRLAKTLEEYGGYRKVEFAGSGGQALVFKALRQNVDSPIAVKVLDPAYCELVAPGTNVATLEQRFRREHYITKVLDHGNIIRSHHFVEVDGLCYVEMEFATGQTLQSLRKKNGRFDSHDVLAILGQVLSAMVYYDELGIVHRDIKPGNLILEDDPRHTLRRSERRNVHVRLLDFGIARVPNDPERDTALTLDCQKMGTPWFAAPEQLHVSARSVTIASDIYSLGRTAIWLLTDLDVGSSQSSVDERLQAVDEPIRQILMRMTAGEAGDRYTSPADALQDVEALTDGPRPLAKRVAPMGRGAFGIGRSRPRLLAAASSAVLVPVLLLAAWQTVDPWGRKDKAGSASPKKDRPTVTWDEGWRLADGGVTSSGGQLRERIIWSPTPNADFQFRCFVQVRSGEGRFSLFAEQLRPSKTLSLDINPGSGWGYVRIEEVDSAGQRVKRELTGARLPKRASHQDAIRLTLRVRGTTCEYFIDDARWLVIDDWPSAASRLGIAAEELALHIYKPEVIASEGVVSLPLER